MLFFSDQALNCIYNMNLYISIYLYTNAEADIIDPITRKSQENRSNFEEVEKDTYFQPCKDVSLQ